MVALRFFACVSMASVVLAAQPPQQSDLSGVWMLQQPSGSFSTSLPPTMTPWAAARFRENRPTIGPDAALDANDPTLDCAPPGLPYILAVPTPFELVQLPTQVIQLFEYSHFVRRIYTDGRPHPADLAATGSHEWLGHSIGRWEGPTLVIETVGFNDQTWLDRLGRPHSDALRVVERVTRTGPDVLDYRVTVYDDKAYAAPWEGRMAFARRAGWEILEHTCVAREDDAYREYRRRAWER
jgi:hypothetical protein